MKPRLTREAEAAMADGRWGRAYNSPGAIQVPADFRKEFFKDKKALAFLKPSIRPTRMPLPGGCKPQKKN